jgi:hypothetical protein
MAVTRISWWQWLPVFRWRVVATCDEADEVPQALPRNAAVLVASGDLMKWLVFDCPCRSGHRMMLPLQGKPRWNVVSMRPLTVAPSVDYRGADRRCHYIMRAGSVDWV